MTDPAAPTACIALDGPSGSGKSTVARGVARRLGWRYVDTGASYRAATLAVLRAGVDPHDPVAVAEVVRAARIELDTDPDRPVVRLDGDDVSDEVRGAQVTAAVSAVSAVPEVRTVLVALQRAAMGSAGAVAEGRDVGTAVVPRARLKVYLDASQAVRAARRSADRDSGVAVPAGAGRAGGYPDEDRATVAGDPGGSSALVAAVAADLARRDALDSNRVASPLHPAPDAVHLDSSGLDAEAVVARVLELAAGAGLLARP